MVSEDHLSTPLARAENGSYCSLEGILFLISLFVDVFFVLTLESLANHRAGGRVNPAVRSGASSLTAFSLFDP